MNKYQITSAAGVELGVYPGETEEDAVAAMQKDAGYNNEEEMEAAGVSRSTLFINEVTEHFYVSPNLVEELEAMTLRAMQDGRPVLSKTNRMLLSQLRSASRFTPEVDQSGFCMGHRHCIACGACLSFDSTECDECGSTSVEEVYRSPEVIG